jgi:predicted nucleic acid-binding protein
MNYLLDTNMVIELRKSSAVINPSVRSWVLARSPETLLLSVITVLELETGVARVERRDPAQGQRLRAWLDERVLTAFRGRVLAVDLEVARRAALMHVPDPRPERDTLIAATALVHAMPVVTRNVKDFGAIGVEVVNPWDAPA